jgi:hypothetical protein
MVLSRVDKFNVLSWVIILIVLLWGSKFNGFIMGISLMFIMRDNINSFIMGE